MGRGGMGKKQHSKDKMYLLQSEWQYEGGGFRGNKGAAAKLPFRRLPYNCCALTLSPFQDPMMTPAGVVYDMLNIIPYVNKNKRCPVTGQPMTLKDLVKLTFHKNDKGQFHCPVMFKEFTPHTHIVAIRTTGNVYCHEAVETLNLKTRNLKDLLTDQPFTKSDIITIQDPQNFDNREIEKFEHIKTGETHSALLKDAEINANEETRRILAKAGLTASSSSAATKRPAGEVGALVVSSAPKKPKPDSNAAAGSDDVKTRKGISSGAMAASFTSSAIDVVTSISEQTLSVMERRREIWSIMRQLGKKGYVQLKTTHGDINLEIRCDCVPQTSENFLTLCARGYYNGVKFHRVIKNFMMQGGDPTGTGKGGESMWKGKFEDEFDSRLRHDGRGVLSMANSGPNTNGSQFFITFKSCHHLDNKHSVFGSVVGGIEILKTIEKEVIVFVNPFEMDLPAYQEAQREKVEEERRAAELKKRREAEDAEGGKDWFTNPAAAAASKQTVYRTGVGKYLKPPTAKEIGSESGASAAAPVIEPTNTEDMWASVPEPPKKKPQPRPGLGNFSGW